MARATPTIRDGVLTYRAGAEERALPVGGDAWWGWLADAGTTSFRFVDHMGGLTVRRERKPGGWYWYAYRRRAGKLRKAYLGRAQELTLARLQATAAAFGRPDPAAVAPAPVPAPPPHAAGPTPPPSAPAGDPLLSTKLYAPPPRPDAVPRPRLIERLAAGLRGKLTLLAAPPGAGKTTLLAAWRASPAGREVPLAWISLDAGDNDPVPFLRYLSAALDTLQPGIAGDALALLASAPPPPPEAVLTVLLNALASLPRDAVLVLDDYHAVAGPAVHQVAAFLLERLPPRLHLVIATRADPPLPLGRLRARGDLAELRAADLRFTVGEAAAFLNEAMELALPAEQVAALAARTEGWAAGLQLAALALQGCQDAPAFIGAFAGSHRFLVDYLAGEVLGRQPAEVQRFLLDTAVLDRLCGPLCDAVTGRADGQAMLEHLEAANLFLVPLDDARHWYRYHHLFAEFLRARLARDAPDRVAERHRRAAAWYEEAGLVREAIGHTLALGDFTWAARLAEQVADQLWMRGESATLLGWLRVLPEEVVRARPRLGLAGAWAQFLTPAEQPDAVESRLASVAAALDDHPADGGAAVGGETAELHGILAAIRSSVASAREDVPGTIALARTALARVPPDNAIWRIVPTMNLGIAHRASGEVTAAAQTLGEAVALSRQTGNRLAALVSMSHLVWVRLAQGELHAAAALCRQGLDLAAEAGGGPSTIRNYSFYVALGRLRYEWDDLAGAERELLEGLARAGHDDHLRGLVDGCAVLARLRQLAGDADGARAALGRAEQAARASAVPWAPATMAAHHARFLLWQGDVAGAARWAAEAGVAPDDAAEYRREFAHLMLARVLLAQGQPAGALGLLERLGRAAEGAGRLGSLVEVLTLRALAHWAAGEVARALAALDRALALAEPEGYIRVFVDEGRPLACLLATWREGRREPRAPTLVAYVARLLAACAPAEQGDTSPPPAPTSAPGIALPEPLTPREREVLRLLAAGHANAAIAARLYVAVSTVKTHVNGIFGKLGATSRTQAVARARALGLLAD